MPSVSFFVEPSGETRLIGTFDRIEATQYVNGGCFFPSVSLPSFDLMKISKKISAVLYEKGVLGHVTVDLVTFPDPQKPGSAPLFWATDLNCNLTDNASICHFFDILMEGQIDPETGEYEVESLEEDPTDNRKNEDMSPEAIMKMS
jgi:hypothetical protein